MQHALAVRVAGLTRTALPLRAQHTALRAAAFCLR